jgi:hypothetical protein
MSALILWFGWNLIRQNVVTKWIAIIMFGFSALILGLYSLGIVLRILPILLPVLVPIFIVAAVYIVWDLFFRAPLEGRSARIHSRRHI